MNGTQSKATNIDFKQIIENLDSGIVVIDFNLNILYSNQRFSDLLGIEDAKSLINQNLFDAANYSESTKTMIRQQMIIRRKGETSTYEIELKRKIGEIIHFHSKGISLYDNEQKIIATMGIITDITKQKINEDLIIKTNEALKRSQARYKALEGFPDLILIENKKGIILDYQANRPEDLNYPLLETPWTNSRKKNTESDASRNWKRYSSTNSKIIR